MENYDAIIIGAGQAGNPLSTTLAKAGWKTALIERKHVGGTCVNEGCTPTKTMAASARVAYLVRRAADYGVQTGKIQVDMSKVRQRKRDIVNRFRGGGQRRIENTEGVDLIFGEASFVDQKTVAVHPIDGQQTGQQGSAESHNTRQFSADKIFINVGTRPILPPIPGIENVPTLDSTSIMELDTVPEHLIVIGGGYIGLEFGQMFRRFGSQVTIIQRSGQLLGREDNDVAEEVANILREDGIKVLLNTNTTQASQDSTGAIQLTVSMDDEQMRTITGSHLLVAAGRTPNTDRLNLKTAGIEINKRGFIPVNPQLETSTPGIYALGDVKGGPAFTHIAYDDFRIIRTNLVDKAQTPATTDGRFIPYTVFIDPQLGRVGLSETEAKAQGRTIHVAKMPMNHVARALEVDETRGFMKAIVDAETDQILGCTILGLEGGEVMTVLQMAMMGNVPYTAIRDGVFSHPTLSESLNNLFMSMDM